MTDTVAEATAHEVSIWVWEEKYRHTEFDGTTKEKTMDDTHERVVGGVYAKDKSNSAKASALDMMKKLIWCPAGRIHAGAGTMKKVTTINCFVSPDIQDSMDTEPGQPGLGIFDALKVAGLTQQMGGGIGMDFSTLRPDRALVKRTHSVSTGPLPFMAMWDSMCATIKSSGARRGAMMAVMRCDHPDVMNFVRAKHTKGVFENFNVSVLVTDAFMKAVRGGKKWQLGFGVPRADGKHVAVLERDGKPWYVYDELDAREMWDEIIRSTFEYAEPGIIFIDRVNEMNNLWYCEYIHATNPCGEQPLPPDGDCNLGAINLAQLVKYPFTDKRTFDIDNLISAVKVGVRFLDNVLDIALFPTEAQREEAHAKRRIGLGITGLGNALQMLQMVYGSDEAISFTEDVMATIRDAAYTESIELAKERGPFPAFDRDKYLEGKFIKTLPEYIQQGIREHGIRNAVLLTIAPTGTTSMYYGNVSSGLEPTIAWEFKRKAREHDGSYREFKKVYDYGYYMFRKVTGYATGEPLPPYMCSALQAPIVPVDAHLKMQAACQKYIDASISKTINCPPDMSFEEFKNVYDMAYDLGCKGCTTYKPSEVRGSVISIDDDKKEVGDMPEIVVVPRPEELEGYTYKIKYPGLEQAFYITINDYIDHVGKRRPFEIFINSKSVKHQEWIVALTRMISAIFRRGGDVTFIVEELQQVFSPNGGMFVNKKYVPSIIALIGNVLEKHFIKIGLYGGEVVPPEVVNVVKKLIDDGGGIEAVSGETCPNCDAPTLHKVEGCDKCASCGYSSCG